MGCQLGEFGVACHLGRRVKAIEGHDKVAAVVLDNGDRLKVSGVLIEAGAKGVVPLTAVLELGVDTEAYQKTQMTAASLQGRSDAAENPVEKEHRPPRGSGRRPLRF